MRQPKEANVTGKGMYHKRVRPEKLGDDKHAIADKKHIANHPGGKAAAAVPHAPEQVSGSGEPSSQLSLACMSGPTEGRAKPTTTDHR